MIEEKKKKIKSMIEALINEKKLEDAKLAIEDYRKVVPDDIDIYSMLGVIYILEKNYDEAIEIMEKGIIKDCNNFDLHYNLGYVYSQINMYKDSFIHYYKAYNNCFDSELKDIINDNLKKLENKLGQNQKNNIINALENIKKVLFIQDVPCIRTNKIAKVIACKGIQVDLLYISAHPLQVYKDIELPYKNMFQLKDINQAINYINNSDYDILYSSNEPDYFTVLFLATNKPIIHDTHDMMSLRSEISNEQVVLEYIANVMASGNIYVHELVKDIAIKKFGIRNKPIFVLNNFIEKSMIPKQRKEKLSCYDGEMHCVFEGGLSNIQGHHRFLEGHFLKLAKEKIHVHIYGNVNLNYIKQLESKSKYIHYEGVLSPKKLLVELTKYDIGLAFFNVTQQNKMFLDTTFANKIFDYLAAGLPIAFVDLISYKMFNEKYNVGKIINFNQKIYKQIEEVKNINIDENILFNNDFIINNQFFNIINFLNKVKQTHELKKTSQEEFIIENIKHNKIQEAENMIRELLSKEKSIEMIELLSEIHKMKGNIILSDYYNKNKLNINSNEIYSKNNIEKPNILIIRSLYSVYITEYIKKIYAYLNYIPDLMTFDEKYYDLKSEGIINNLLVINDENEFLNALNNINYYDIIHIHYVTPLFAKYSKQIKKKCEKLVVTIWGSDYYRSDYEIRRIQKELYDEADLITFDNEETMKDFINFYGDHLKNKTTVNRFGLTALEHIDEIDNYDKKILKKQFGIPEDYIVITCGYNATKAHNHIKIIQELNNVKNKLHNNIFLLFPMTYGKEQAYILEVKQLLDRSGFKFKIIEDFMNFKEVAIYTKLTDIMIQLQTTDTLSASMQEHLYSGNIVITGEWLPYKILEDKDIFFIKVKEINELGEKLVEIINNLDYYKEKCKNKEKIKEISAWDKTIYNWYFSYIKLFLKQNNKECNFQKKYWNDRYGKKFTIESSGYMGLGEIYNKYIYKSKIDVLNHLKDKILNGYENKNLLELGPGTGYFTNYFMNNNIGAYYGIDISEVSINNLRDKFKKGNFFTGDITNINSYPKDLKYDLIFSASVLLHMTDDEMLKNVINNISLNLKEEGYFIEIDPITMIGTDIRSDYMRVIDYNKLEKILIDYGLEIVCNIPVAFFLDQPFDYNILGYKGEIVRDIFYKIKNLINNNCLSDEHIDVLSKLFYLFDKICLLKYDFGLSQKFLIIRKSCDKINEKISIGDIWKKELIFLQINDLLNKYKNLMNTDSVKEIIESIYEVL
ncbi:Glycosyl transferase 4-like [Caloramator quimbayensis]|uniref:Glycosyl transferase 4-like n=1 Tax=Caloramator quimbayensis TaxID=1147123 RepID=A0A1T4X9I5_9CLOT|nr:methyltransferase domain-containing protein [Caloramator quimbayensis]SKA86236.1 Glycosyl transferase 4-like [Caloramator quimbayensis]